MKIDADIREFVRNMTLRQKLGQLIVSRPIAANIEENLSRGEIGGLYFAGTPTEEIIAKYRKLSPFPLIIAQDLEMGKTALGPVWPTAMAVSAADSPEDAYRWAFAHGRQARSSGVNAAFGPVLDVALSDLADNTGFRSVGSDPERVAEYCAQMVRGYQDAGIIPFAKHYPGFGRAQGDPHMELSLIEPDADVIRAEELLPYRRAIEKAGLWGVMSGHVLAPQLDDLPATVSKKILGMLREELGFDGLLITDSLSMQGILQWDHSQYLYENTILAGHDMFLANYNLDDGVCLDYLEEAVKSGRLPLELVEEKVCRIMMVKRQLEAFKPLEWDAAENMVLYDKIAEKSPSFYREDGGAFEALDPDGEYLCVIFTEDQKAVAGELSGAASLTGTICSRLESRFANMKILAAPLCPGGGQIQDILREALSYDKVVVIAHTLCYAYIGSDSLSYQVQSVIRALSRRMDTLVIWGTPYASKPALPYVKQTLFVYDSNRVVLDRVLSGEIRPDGVLPVKLN